MKILVAIVRTLMGLLFLFGSVTYLFNLMPQPELTGNVKEFMEGLLATGYFMTLLKGTELVCGLAFVTNHYVPLASVVIAPVIINIFLFHLVVEPSGLIIAIFLVIANLLVGISNWDKYRPMLAVR